METVFLEKYIREYLLQHRTLIRRTYCRSLKETMFRQVNTPELNRKMIKSTYNIVGNLFEDILKGSPMKYPELMMANLEASYNDPAVRLFDDLSDFPEGLMQRYSLLFQVLAGFVPNYSSDLRINHRLIEEMEELESQIEILFHENYKKIQRKIYRI